MIRRYLFLTLSLAVAGCGGSGYGGGADGAPAAPAGLAVTLAGSSASLSWIDYSSDETGFEVERYTTTGGWAVQFNTGANVTTATSSGLEPGTAYAFRVRAINGAGKSGFSNEVPVNVVVLDQPNRNPVAPYTPNYLGSLTAKLKWGSPTITYFIDKGPETRDIALLQAVAEKAAARWNTATNGLVTLTRVDSAASANIQISFVAPSDPALAGGDEGSAEYTYTDVPGGRSLLATASVKVKSGLSDSLLLPLLAHELGHTLGIGGHSADASDNMYPVVNASTLISSRDANTLSKLYLTTE